MHFSYNRTHHKTDQFVNGTNKHEAFGMREDGCFDSKPKGNSILLHFIGKMRWQI